VVDCGRDVGIVDGEVCGEMDAVVPTVGNVAAEPDTVVSAVIPVAAWLFWDLEGAAGFWQTLEHGLHICVTYFRPLLCEYSQLK
jgi:hypothetical protein